MKPGIHPNYVEATVTCACGNSFTTRSTKPNLRTDLCSVCHPFHTGEQRIVDTAGQVERFMRRMEGAAQGDSRVSKRQQRLNARELKLEDERRRAEEARAAEAAEAAAARAEARAAQEAAAAEAADSAPADTAEEPAPASDEAEITPEPAPVAEDAPTPEAEESSSPTA